MTKNLLRIIGAAHGLAASCLWQFNIWQDYHNAAITAHQNSDVMLSGFLLLIEGGALILLALG